MFKPTLKFNELIISSGGIKGYHMLGILSQINQYHPLNNFQYLTGTSMGSILATFIATGCTLEEIEAILIKINWFEFMDIKLIHFIEQTGFIDTHRLSNLFRAMFEYKNLNKNITFLELFNLNHKFLTLCVTNITKRKAEYHNHITTPNLSIIESIIMSISIPFVFKPVKYQGCIYLDGAILDHFPYYYHKHTKKMGICSLDRDIFKEIEQIQENSFDSNPLFDLMKDILSTLLEENLRLKCKYKKPKNTIYLVEEINCIEFDMELKHKYDLMKRGTEIAKRYFYFEFKKRRKYYLIKKYSNIWIHKYKK